MRKRPSAAVSNVRTFFVRSAFQTTMVAA